MSTPIEEQAHHGLYSCKTCGKEFPGPNGAYDWQGHRCPAERVVGAVSQELATRRHVREMDLIHAARNVITIDGWLYLAEALMRECDRYEEATDGLTQTLWHQRSRLMSEASEI